MISSINNGMSASSWFTMADTNSNNSINFEEFSSLEESEKAKEMGLMSPEDLFSQIDTDGNGELTEVEATEFAKSEIMGPPPGINSESMSMLLDKNMSDILNSDTFESLLEMTKAESATTTDEILTELEDGIDTTKSDEELKMEKGNRPPPPPPSSTEEESSTEDSYSLFSKEMSNLITANNSNYSNYNKTNQNTYSSLLNNLL